MSDRSLLAPDNMDQTIRPKEKKMSRAMKWIANSIGVILTLIGIFWILQGINLIPVGGMAGKSQWVVIGSFIGIAGIGLLVYVNRRARGSA